MRTSNRVDRPRHRKSVRDFVLYCCLVRTLRQQPTFLRARRGFVIVVLPVDYEPDHFRRATADVLYGMSLHSNDPAVNSFNILAKTRRERILREFLDDYQHTKMLLGFADSREAIPPVVELAADAIIDLSPITPRDLRAACRVVAKIKISDDQAKTLLSFPIEMLLPCLREGRGANDIISRLTRAAAADKTTQRQGELPTLAEMYGYGPAKTWGLELSKDFADWKTGRISWDDVDRGIILSGPPGVGKTIFARALAKQCDAQLVATSLGQWQAKGHLGDLLKSMRSDFARARENAPSILFIDELDGIGDRAKFSDDHKSYSVQVVNAFLECLDGLEGREGVVVVAATNHIKEIDPAILRPGRLDRQIEIPLPAAEDRVQILHQQLRQTIDLEELAGLKQRTEGMTGADLAKAVRDARRIARRAKRPIVLSDLEAALPPILALSTDHVRANAIHEGGHTLVGLRLHIGEFIETTVTDKVVVGSAVSVGGQARFSHMAVARREKRFYLDQIALCLAGIAAEEVILGGFSDGAGMSGSSDLANATHLATILVTQLGMSATLRFSRAHSEVEFEALRRSDVKLRAAIDDILVEQLERSKAIVQNECQLLERFADELVTNGVLTAARAAEIEAELNFKAQMATLRAS